MSYAIIYSSSTGNTASLASRILQIFPKDELIYCGAPSETALAADILFVGFWTQRGTADAATCAFLPKIQNKKIFLFGTAGFVGGEAYYDGIIERITQLLPDGNQIIGSFVCRGKMPHEVCLRYRTALMNRPNNIEIMKMIDNFDKAANHPDEYDFENLLKAVKNACNIKKRSGNGSSEKLSVT